MTHNNASTIRARIDLFLPPLRRSFSNLFNCPDPNARYLQYLVLLHGFVRASVPLMEEALKILFTYDPTDRLKEPLSAYLESHLEEERGHDQWLLEDIEVLGISRNQVLNLMPSVNVASMVGSQYYWIRHYHPVMLLGYISVLEGSPPSKTCIGRIKEITGLPEQAFRTLQKHGDIDPHHTKELDDLFHQLPLRRDQVDAICISACLTVDNVISAFEKLQDQQIQQGAN